MIENFLPFLRDRRGSVALETAQIEFSAAVEPADDRRDQLKEHLNIDVEMNVDDDVLSRKIDAAQECVEKFIGAKLDDEEAFPDGDFDEAKAFLSGEQLEYRRIEI